MTSNGNSDFSYQLHQKSLKKESIAFHTEPFSIPPTTIDPAVRTGINTGI